MSSSNPATRARIWTRLVVPSLSDSTPNLAPRNCARVLMSGLAMMKCGSLPALPPISRSVPPLYALTITLSGVEIEI